MPQIHPDDRKGQIKNDQQYAYSVVMRLDPSLRITTVDEMFES